MKKIVLAMGVVMWFVAMGETKIATINMMDLVQLHPQHESNRALVKSTDKDYKAKLDTQQEGLKAIADDGKKAQDDLTNPMLSQAAKVAAQKKLESVQQKFLAARQEMDAAIRRYQDELSDLEGRLLKLETEDIRKKIAAYAKEKGLDLVLDATMVGYANPALDVTDDILKSMGVDPAKRATVKKDAKDAKSDDKATK